MTRAAFLAALAVLGSAAPAPATPTSYVVYEAYAVRPGSPGAMVRVSASGRYGRSVFATIRLARDGSTYRSLEFGTMETARFQASYWPVENVPGHRYFFAAPRRARMRFDGLPAAWRVRSTSFGFRAVPTDRTDSDRNVGGSGFDHFHAATVTGGRYGSTVFADVPCAGGVGSWSLSAGDSEVDSGTCFNSETPIADARTATRWTLEGPILGKGRLWHRIVVFDHPRY